MSHFPRIAQLGSGGAGILGDSRGLVLNGCALVFHQGAGNPRPPWLGWGSSYGWIQEPNTERPSLAALPRRLETPAEPRGSILSLYLGHTVSPELGVLGDGIGHTQR